MKYYAHLFSIRDSFNPILRAASSHIGSPRAMQQFYRAPGPLWPDTGSLRYPDCHLQSTTARDLEKPVQRADSIGQT
ncbi:hypothetical protein NECAME_07889 [Necator americanus]|uniref:Uncharacterized protein n=1 Tax=Necator americanus TaxID=51031 RepID=W2TLP9_NECAM|nr:hypothetical protein NECAME_07889 [Necator americanus]ETN82554.1 hypothetical protein NECAME_07889 [Necator americanus]